MPELIFRKFTGWRLVLQVLFCKHRWCRKFLGGKWQKFYIEQSPDWLQWFPVVDFVDCKLVVGSENHK